MKCTGTLRSHGGAVVHVWEAGGEKGRADRREGEVRLQWAGRLENGVGIEIEGVQGEGQRRWLRLRVARRGRLIERVVVQRRLIGRVLRQHWRVVGHRRDLW